jgi:hypothetical protein
MFGPRDKRERFTCLNSSLHCMPLDAAVSGNLAGAVRSRAG